MRENKCVITVGAVIVIASLVAMLILEFSDIAVLPLIIQPVFIGHRAFYVGLVMSVFTGAIITVGFSIVIFKRKQRDVFEFLTCLHDRIIIFQFNLERKKDTDVLGEGLKVLKDEYTELKKDLVEFAFNELNSMFKFSKKKRKIIHLMDDNVSILLDCEKELSYYELVFEEIIIGSKEPQKYQSVYNKFLLECISQFDKILKNIESIEALYYTKKYLNVIKSLR